MAELTTVAKVRTELGDSAADSSLITDIIAGAEDYIARRCRRWHAGGSHWLSSSRVERIDGDLATGLCLRWTPITAVASISLTASSGSSISLTTTDFHLDGIALASLAAGATTQGNEGILEYYASSVAVAAWFDGGYPRPSPFVRSPNLGSGKRSVVVTYTGGYASAPPDLARAATSLAAQMYRDHSINPSLSSERLGDYAWTRSEAVADQLVGFQDILDLHARPTD